MNFLNKGLIIFVLTAFVAVNSSAKASDTNAIPKEQNTSLFRRICSSVAEAVKSKKCIAATATAVTAISAAALLWYSEQTPTSPTPNVDSLINFIKEYSSFYFETCPIETSNTAQAYSPEEVITNLNRMVANQMWLNQPVKQSY